MSSPADTSETGALSRRTFLKVSTAAGGGLMLGFQLPAFAQEGPAKYVLNPNAFIAIAPDGKVAFQIPQEEMGQGVYTSLSQLLADELDVDFAQVTPLPAPPIDALYGSPRSHRMSTGGSTSIRSFYTALRQVGASGRAMMVQAAAQQWKV
ncbi:MAG TPA: molybdopterin cofactor-binding domain-containing protein, partial [Rhizomicrobium sp.]|nr:molybdopterin cofactor-binding domain-containing protein [Rhizomicrobium sp.]